MRRISVSLCCTSGWSMTWTCRGHDVVMSHGASRIPCRRCRCAAAAAPPRSARASARPAAQVPPSSTQASGICSASTPSARAPAAPARRAAPPSARATRPPARRRPSRCARAHAGSRGTSTPVSSSRPPLRYSGRPVSASSPRTVDAGPLERLEQRVASATATACGTAPARRQARRRATAGWRQQSPSG